jgi:hypothetical protein
MSYYNFFYPFILLFAYFALFAPAFAQERMDIVNQQLDWVESTRPPHAVASNITSPNITPFVPAYTSVSKKPHIDFEITPEVSHVKYRETVVKKQTFMKERGIMSGLNANFTFRTRPGDDLYTEILDMYRVESRFSYGKVNYSGSNDFHGISDYMVEIRGLAGKDFDLLNRWLRLTPYFGAGYRSLFDGFYADKPGGYNRHIQYLYVPAGTDITAKLIGGWSIGLNAEYDFFIRGYVQSNLEEIGLGQLNNTQGSGYGVRGSIKIVKNCNRFNVFMEPFVRFWHIHESKLRQSSVFTLSGQQFVILGSEPDNTSLEIGGKLGIEF